MVDLGYFLSDEFHLTLTFGQIEGILGAVLPASARHHQAWWANQKSGGSHVQPQSWLPAGWRVEALDPMQGWVRFVRG